MDRVQRRRLPQPRRGLGGGYPAFYRLEGDRIAITRLEAIRTGKCAGTPELANGTPALRAAAAASERRLAAFIDRLSGWSRDGDVLILTARDGTRAVLTTPAEPHPELAGRWLIESIGGAPLVTERRPPILSIAMSRFVFGIAPATGLLREWTGNYQLAFIGVIGLFALATILFGLLVASETRSRATAPAGA